MSDGMLTFEPFRIWYDRQKKKRTDMRLECGFAPGTITKIFSDGFPVRSDIIETICKVYNLRIEQVIAYREVEEDGRQ
ncbi:helix-turn-helix domain-containing protein [Paenibacillus enshidis]|uniref:Helix-turn-helix domain-containing protein n=1 Tax=Paenibacillus enshidis TaxID=1458439 RepID=A0ABV5AYL3_9BACL